jgi:hypothetical protein
MPKRSTVDVTSKSSAYAWQYISPASFVAV